MTIPADGRYTGYRYEVDPGVAGGDCLAGKECPGGRGRWPFEPILLQEGRQITVVSVFAASSGGTASTAVLTAYWRTGKR